MPFLKPQRHFGKLKPIDQKIYTGLNDSDWRHRWLLMPTMELREILQLTGSFNKGFTAKNTVIKALGGDLLWYLLESLLTALLPLVWDNQFRRLTLSCSLETINNDTHDVSTIHQSLSWQVLPRHNQRGVLYCTPLLITVTKIDIYWHYHWNISLIRMKTSLWV